VYCNDSSGNEGSDNVIFYKNTSIDITEVVIVNDTGTSGGEVARGDNFTINATVVNATTIGDVWAIIWETVIGGNVIWQGFLNFISGNLWGVVVESNWTFPVGDVNYTVYVNDTIGQEVNESGNFTVVESFNVSECRELDQANSVYYLVSNIDDDSLNGPCMNITAQNITLDCLGNYIASNDDESGVYSNQFNTTIRDCNISMGTGAGGYGIELVSGANNSSIINNTLEQSISILISDGVSNCIIDDNVAKTSCSSVQCYSIYIGSGIGNIIRRNYAGNTKIGLYLSGSSDSVIINNTINITVTPVGSLGISSNSASNNVFRNNSVYISSSYIAAYFVSYNNNNSFIENTFISDSSIAFADFHGRDNTFNMTTVEGTTGFYFRNTTGNITDCMNVSGSTNDVGVASAANGTNVNLINCSYNLSKESVEGAENYLFRKWYYQAYVNDSNSNHVIADVLAYNKTDDLVENFSTNASGWTGKESLIEYVNIGGTIYYYNNYTINVTNSSYETGSYSYNVSSVFNKLDNVYTLTLFGYPYFNNTQANESFGFTNKTYNFSTEVIDETLVDSAWFQHNFLPNITDTQQQLSSTRAQRFGDTYLRAQSFKVDSTGKVINGSVELAFQAGSPGSIIVEIRSDEGNSPSSNIIANATIPAFTDTSNQNYSFSFGKTANLTSGVSYWLVLSSPSSNNKNSYEWTYTNNPDSYAEGETATSTDSGSTWSNDPNLDRVFTINIAEFPMRNETSESINSASGITSFTQLFTFEGDYYWSFCANDSSGNENCTSSKLFYVYELAETNPPNLYFIQYPNGKINGEQIVFSGYAQDDYMVKNLSLQFKNGTNPWETLITNTTSTVRIDIEYNFNSTPYEDDANLTFRLLAYDTAENNNETNITLVVDHNVTILSENPTQNPWITPNYNWYSNDENITLRLNITDGSGAGINNTQADLSNINGSGYKTMSLESGSKATGSYSAWNLTLTIDTTT